MIARTNRIILRDLELHDSQIFLEYRSDAELCKYQSFMVDNSEEVISFINTQKNIKIGHQHEWKQIAISLNNDTLIGDCAIQFTEDEPRIAEIGCTIRKEFHNHGYATEALSLLIDHVFNEFPIHKFKALVDIRNLPSQRILTKIGFELEGHFKKHYWDKNDKAWFDELQYGLITNVQR